MDADIPADNSRRTAVIQYVETTIRRVTQELQKRPVGNASVTLRRLDRMQPEQDLDTGEIHWHVQDHEATYSWPGKSKEEAWRFACVLRILNEIHAAISDNNIVTKRDVFYRDPRLFLRQETVDRYVDDISHTCGVSRSDLNIAASPKGLVLGLREDHLADPENIDINTKEPSLEHLDWVLVVEKEATFNTLAEKRFHILQSVGRGMIVTAKGYPDLTTRRFLRSIIDHSTFDGPVFGLFDYDPYGIDILRNYRVGSKASALEEDIDIPGLIWLGLKLDDIMQAETMQLTANDRRRAQAAISRISLEDGRGIPGLEDCKHESQRMLLTNAKAEIQAVDNERGGLTKWLEARMSQYLCPRWK